MSNLFFTSDAHLGHRAIGMYRDGIAMMEQNTERFVEEWKQKVSRKTNRSKMDLVMCLGDMAFDSTHNDIIRGLPGRKFLIRGNHDYVPMKELVETYEEIHGLLQRRGFWLSHAPIHPAELYDRVNIHGHVHEKTIISEQYLNVCVDALMLNFGCQIIDVNQLREYAQMARDGEVKIAEPKDYSHKKK